MHTYTGLSKCNRKKERKKNSHCLWSGFKPPDSWGKMRHCFYFLALNKAHRYLYTPAQEGLPNKFQFTTHTCTPVQSADHFYVSPASTSSSLWLTPYFQPCNVSWEGSVSHCSLGFFTKAQFCTASQFWFRWGRGYKKLLITSLLSWQRRCWELL